MPSFIQNRKCNNCGTRTSAQVCPKCNTTTALISWSVVFRIINNDGQRVQKKLSGFSRKALAQVAYNEFMSRYVPPAYKPIKKSVESMKFAELYQKYKAYIVNEIKESSYIKTTNKAENYILPFFYDKTVTKICELDIVEWKNRINDATYTKGGIEKKLAYKMKTSIFSILVHILNFAIKFYRLPRNVATIVGTFKNHDELKKEMSYWTLPEFKQFISVADNIIYKTAFETLYYTGMRKGELLALQWQDISLTEKSIVINKTASWSTIDSVYKITTPKSKNSNRRITIPDILHKSLCELKQARKIDNLGNDTDYVFGGKRVCPQQNLLNYMIAWCAKSGVKRIRIHDLRHSHVSLLISTGGNSLSLVYVIAKRIGDNPEQIFETYGHLFPDDEKKVLDNLNSILTFNTE